jgi:hypothetical protein
VVSGSLDQLSAAADRTQTLIGRVCHLTTSTIGYYYDKVANYVVRRDDTGEIIQVSDRNKPGWIDSRTDKPIYPRE